MSEIKIKYWNDCEDNQLLNEMLNNVGIKKISQIHDCSEFEISLRIHLLIHRMNVAGLSVSDIRKKTGVPLSEILGVICPVKPTINNKIKNWSSYFLW